MTTNKIPLSEKRRNVAWEEINDREGDVIGYNYSMAFKEEDVRDAVRRLQEKMNKYWFTCRQMEENFQLELEEIYGKELTEEEKQNEK